MKRKIVAGILTVLIGLQGIAMPTWGEEETFVEPEGLLAEDMEPEGDYISEDTFTEDAFDENVEDSLSIVGDGITSGQCGDNVHWNLENGVLTISGEGDMWDFNWDHKYEDFAPWYDDRSSIQSVVIGTGIISIGDSAFYQCSSLTSIELPIELTSIGEDAFGECSSLTNIELPPGLTSIDKWAFNRCYSLKSMFIPANVTYIGEGAFFLCDNMDSIIVAENNMQYSSDNGALLNKEKTELIYCPGGMAGIYIIPDTANTIIKYAFHFCEHLEGVIIPDSVVIIEDSAFEGCRSLASIEIPASVRDIGYNVFDICDELVSINVSEDNDYYYSKDGVFFGQDDTLIQCPGGKTGVYYIPEGTKYIGTPAYHAFYNCEKLTEVIIPNSVKSIGFQCFMDCTGLEKVTIGRGITEIQGYAFQDCESLKEIYFRGDAPEFEYGVFEDITAIAYYPKNSETWTADVLEDYDGNITWVPYNPEIELSTYRLALKEGETETISVTISNDDQVVSWESGDTSIATVDNGMVTGVSPGKTVITVTFASGIVITVEVNVKRVIKLELDITAVATIAENGEIAYFSFVPEKTNTYVFYSISEEDTYGYLYDAEMNEITSNDDRGEDCNFRIECRLNAGEQYYFGARFYSDMSGLFDVRLEASSDAPALYDNTLTLPSTTTTIESEAFAGLDIPVNIVLPESVTTIASDAFSGSTVIIIGESGSYAEEYCSNNGLTFVENAVIE